MYHNIGIKHSMLNEISTYLWHKHLGHIYKKRLERLVKNGIFQNLDFTNLGLCVDYIKGKQTKHNKRTKATRNTQLLELMHTNICKPFDNSIF